MSVRRLALSWPRQWRGAVKFPPANTRRAYKKRFRSLACGLGERFDLRHIKAERGVHREVKTHDRIAGLQLLLYVACNVALGASAGPEIAPDSVDAGHDQQHGQACRQRCPGIARRPFGGHVDAERQQRQHRRQQHIELLAFKGRERQAKYGDGQPKECSRRQQHLAGVISACSRAPQPPGTPDAKQHQAAANERQPGMGPEHAVAHRVARQKPLQNIEHGDGSAVLVGTVGFAERRYQHAGQRGTGGDEHGTKQREATGSRDSDGEVQNLTAGEQHKTIAGP